MAGYDSNEAELLDEKSDFSAIFSTRELFWILLKYPVIRALDVKPDLNGYYIQNLSVDPEHRGKGIGTQLLEYASSHSIEKGIQSLYLDVDLENSKARNLYERMGFRVIRKIRLLFPCLGVYRMEKKLD
jgi:ribosomal protein S18 acetylase RimI-like enzyme